MLPEEYGGRCSCPGGCIPRPQYDVTATVPSRDKLVRQIECPAGGGELAWSFSTKDHNVAFGVEWTPASGGAKGKVVAVPCERVDSHHYPVSGSHLTNEAGTWTVTWDNSFSYFTSKELSYTVNVSDNASKQAEEAQIKLEAL